MMEKLSAAMEIPGWPEYWFSYSLLGITDSENFCFCLQIEHPTKNNWQSALVAVWKIKKLHNETI